MNRRPLFWLMFFFPVSCGQGPSGSSPDADLGLDVPFPESGVDFLDAQPQDFAPQEELDNLVALDFGKETSEEGQDLSGLDPSDAEPSDEVASDFPEPGPDEGVEDQASPPDSPESPDALPEIDPGSQPEPGGPDAGIPDLSPDVPDAAGCSGFVLGLGCPCATHSDCESGFCEESDGIRRCADHCLDVNCDDGFACTKDACDPATGECTHVPNNKKCDDNNVCTADECHVVMGCVNTPKYAVPCDDGDLCTRDDTCAAGVCQGDPVPGCCKTASDCDDLNPCTVESCIVETGECQHDAGSTEGTPCDADGNGCTVGDVCHLGICVAGDAVTCPDGGNVCAGEGVCVSTGPDTYTCKGPIAASGTPCMDGNPCTLKDQCDGKGNCVAGPLAPNCCKTDADCDDHDSCTQDTCITGIGKCAFADRPDGVACDADGNGCTADSCLAGTCVVGPLVVCPPSGNPCLREECSSTGPSTHACKSVPVAPEDACDDANPCTLDGCDVKAAKCTHLPVADKTPCNADGNGCTVGDSCKAGVCLPGPAADCGPSGTDPCFHVGCTSTGPDAFACGPMFEGAETPCDDGRFCTVGDHCDGKGECVGGAVQTCGLSLNVCETTECDEDAKECRVVPAPDGVWCDADGDGCTRDDACIQGICMPGQNADCTEKDGKCRIGVCQSVSPDSFECVAELAPAGSACEDGLFCTAQEACDAKGNCIAGGQRDCAGEVGGPCAVGICDEWTRQCMKLPLPAGTSCDDGRFCTVGDACDGEGNCAAGPGAPDCEPAPGDACITGRCNPLTDSCEKVPKEDGLACDDGKECTTGDRCVSGVCTPELDECGQ